MLLRRSVSRVQFGVRAAHTAHSVVFSNFGPPREVLSAVQHEIPDAEGDTLVVRLVAAPVNPADINQIEGVYPSKPKFTRDLKTDHEVAVPGNEGVFEVIDIGDEVDGFKVGEWVIPRTKSFGTWTTHKQVKAKDLMPIGNPKGLKPVDAATVAVNPSTAYRLLQDFAPLEPGDYFIQNGGNSGVGRMAIQLAHLWGYKSISVVRDRRDIDSLKSELTELGANYVLTEEQIGDKSVKHVIRDWTRGADIKLALNCVGGRSATNIARQLGDYGQMVTYGGMSKQPVALGTAMYIFKDIASKGFWLTRWSEQNPQEREGMIKTLLDMFRQKEIRTTGVTTTPVNVDAKDNQFLAAFEKAIEGGGKQVIVAEDPSKEISQSK